MSEPYLTGIESIKPDPQQPRKYFDKSHIEGLAVSLKQEGMINPVEVDSDMIIITGECRWRAAKEAGWTEIPILINNKKLSPYQRLRHQMAENVHQSGSTYDTMMHPLDTARGYARIAIIKYLHKQPSTPGVQGQVDWKVELEIAKMPESKLNDEYHKIMAFVEKGGGKIESVINEIAGEIGIARTTIYEHLNLLKQPEFVQKAIEDGVPRTYFREADRAPEQVRNKIREKIADKDYKSRDEVIQDVTLARKIPDLALVEIERQKAKVSTATNRILNSIARLALALKDLPFVKVDIRERGIVIKQLHWLEEKMDSYLEGEVEI